MTKVIRVFSQPLSQGPISSARKNSVCGLSHDHVGNETAARVGPNTATEIKRVNQSA